MNYEIYDKKLLVIVKAFRQWKAYLKRSSDSVQVFTDHKNLIYFTMIKIFNWWQVCWSEELSNFNFEIYYQTGSENAKADVLSRRSDYMKNKSQTIESVLSLQKNGEITYNTRTIAVTLLISNNELKEVICHDYLKDKQAQQVL